MNCVNRALAVQRILFIGLVAFDLAIPLILTIIGGITHYRVPLSFYVASLSIGVAAFLSGAGHQQIRERAEPVRGCARSHPALDWSCRRAAGRVLLLATEYPRGQPDGTSLCQTSCRQGLQPFPGPSRDFP